MSDEELTLSVSQYIDVVNNVLKSTMGEGVWVQGEIEGFNNRTKHTYSMLWNEPMAKRPQ